MTLCVCSALALLAADVPAVVKAAAKQLGEKSVKTRVGVFGVLRELLGVLPDSLAQHVAALLPGVLHALQVCGTQLSFGRNAFWSLFPLFFIFLLYCSACERCLVQAFACLTAPYWSSKAALISQGAYGCTVMVPFTRATGQHE